MPPKKSKPIKLREESSSSSEDAKNQDEELYKQLEQDLSVVVTGSATSRRGGKQYKKRIMNYPQIRLGLNDAQVEEIEKLQGTLRTVTTFEKLLHQQFEHNASFLSENSNFESYLKTYEKNVKNFVLQQKEQRTKMIEVAGKDYVRPEKDEYEMRKQETMISLMRKVIKLSKAKTKNNERNIHGRVSKAKSNTRLRQVDIAHQIVKIIQRIGLQIEDYQLQSKIRSFERKTMQKFSIGIQKRKLNVSQVQAGMSITIDRIEMLQQSMKRIFNNSGQLMMYQNKQKGLNYSSFDLSMSWVIQNVFFVTSKS